MTFAEARDPFDVNSPSDAVGGNIRGRHAHGTNTPAVGHLYELWDKDPVLGTDDYIGRFIKTTDGWGCSTFEWEGSPAAADGEANPDVYVVYINEVRKTTLSGDKVQAIDESGAPHPMISWRNGTLLNPDAYVAVDCSHGSNCNIRPGNVLAITSSTNTPRDERVNALDTAQRALDGEGNRKRNEVKGHGTWDPDGMNLRDYYENNTGHPGFGATFFTSVLSHNCTSAQDVN